MADDIRLNRVEWQNKTRQSAHQIVALVVIVARLLPVSVRAVVHIKMRVTEPLATGARFTLHESESPATIATNAVSHGDSVQIMDRDRLGRCYCYFGCYRLL